MVRRPDDETPEPPGGRAAARLREFQAARAPVAEEAAEAPAEDAAAAEAPAEEQDEDAVERGD
jgi:hypothetical protein